MRITLKELSAVLLFCLALALCLSCATSPLGRKQLLLVPSSQMDQMGVEGFDQIKQKTPIDHDEKTNQYVRCIAEDLMKETDGKVDPSHAEIVVFKENVANAFALPGGKIGVYDGILKVAKNQDQLAAVIGHELGHVIAKHGAERISDAFAAQGVAEIVALVLAEKKGVNFQTSMALLGLGAQFGFLLPFSRTQESEADLIGEKLMAKAGFDPEQSIELWKNMIAAGGAQPPQWLSTHPANENRIRQLQAKLPEAEKLHRQAVSEGKKPNCNQFKP